MNNRKPDYYVLQPVYPPEPGAFSIVNASVGICGLCGEVATGMGGSNNQICVRCAGIVRSGRARGLIKPKAE